MRRRSAAAVLVVGIATCSQRAEVPTPPAGSVADADLAALVDASVAEVQGDPRDAQAWASLAMVYDANSFPALAATCYRRALDVQPGEAAWWYDLAVVLEREDRWEEALDAANRAAAIEPEYPPLHRSVAMWSLARGRLPEAEAAAHRAVETSKGAAGALIALGRVQLEIGRDEDAATSFANAVAKWPAEFGDPGYARFLLGTALRRLGRTDEAAPYLADGPSSPPSLPDPWRADVARRREGFTVRARTARELLDAGRPNAAVALLEELHARRPDDVQVAIDLATAHRMLSRPDDAVRVLEAAAAAHPEAVEAADHLARALFAAGRTEEAFRTVDAAIVAHPRSAHARETRGSLRLRAGRADEALADFETAARLAPESASARSYTGAAELRLERVERAQAAFEAALRLDPADVTAISGMAILALRRGDVPAADGWLAKIEHVGPQASVLVPEAREARRRAK